MAEKLPPCFKVEGMEFNKEEYAIVVAHRYARLRGTDVVVYSRTGRKLFSVCPLGRKIRKPR